jgi:GTP:adenosylcobinamide-phosphate guanylyltransferase
MATYAGLVLAGRREGIDPFAEAVGASHRALIPVAGVPMVLRVLRCLEDARAVANLTVSIDRPDLLAEIPDIALATQAGRLAVHPSRSSVSHSVADALDQIGLAAQPVLVTTADHALLTPKMVDHCTALADASDADLLVGFVSKRILQAAHPESTRTYIPLRDDAWSGANLFVFRTPAARRAAEFWMRAERHRKRPWRLASAISPGALFRFMLGRLDLAAALAYISRTVGCRVEAMQLPFAEAAIDVDRQSDLELAEEILAARSAR